MRQLPPASELKRRLTYDPSTGDLTWLPRGQADWDARFAGKRAGRLSNGYVYLRIDGVSYAAHRVIWKIVNDTDPAIIDHANGDKADNRLENLREATHQENMRNRRSVSNQFGLKGVRPDRNKWCAFITVDGARKYLGSFDTKERAARAYDEFARQAFGEFAATNQALGLVA